MNKIVAFVEKDDENCDICYGLFVEDLQQVICLDCGSQFDLDDIEILANFEIDVYLKDYIRDWASDEDQNE